MIAALLVWDDGRVLPEWDRVIRSTRNGIKILDRVAARDAFVKVLERPYLDLIPPMSKGLLALLSARAEDEQQRIVRRAAEGPRIAKTKGRTFGRKRKLTKHQQRDALDRL